MPIPNRKAVTLLAASKVFLQTDGSATDRYQELELPDDVAAWGPYLESVRALTIAENRTTHHRWNVVLQWTLDDGKSCHPATPEDLFTKITADDHVIHSAYTTTTDLAAPRLRFSLACSNSSGTRESATVTVYLVFTFRADERTRRRPMGLVNFTRAAPGERGTSGRRCVGAAPPAPRR